MNFTEHMSKDGLACAAGISYDYQTDCSADDASSGVLGFD